MVKPGERKKKWAAARCNDGTPFGYVIRRGTSPNWVITLSSGSYCDDEWNMCSERKPQLTTTLPEADGARGRIKPAGVFSPDRTVNPTFADATHVDAHYCSSDLWFGDSLERRPTTGDPRQGWYFSGRENVRALLEALVEIDGLDESDPETRILLLGTSAGGYGVVGNFGAVVSAFPDAVADGRLKVVLDGSWVAPPPEGSEIPNLSRWGPAEPSCESDLRAKGKDPKTCAQGPVWWPYIARYKVPILVQISGLDKLQAAAHGIDTPAEQAAWRRQVRRSLAQVPWVFSGARPYHMIAINEEFSMGPPRETFREVLSRFWAGDPPEKVWYGYDPE